MAQKVKNTIFPGLLKNIILRIFFVKIKNDEIFHAVISVSKLIVFRNSLSKK